MGNKKKGPSLPAFNNEPLAPANYQGPHETPMTSYPAAASVPDMTQDPSVLPTVGNVNTHPFNNETLAPANYQDSNETLMAYDPVAGSVPDWKQDPSVLPTDGNVNTNMSNLGHLLQILDSLEYPFQVSKEADVVYVKTKGGELWQWTLLEPVLNMVPLSNFLEEIDSSPIDSPVLSILGMVLELSTKVLTFGDAKSSYPHPWIESAAASMLQYKLSGFNHNIVTPMKKAATPVANDCAQTIVSAASSNCPSSASSSWTPSLSSGVRSLATNAPNNAHATQYPGALLSGHSAVSGNAMNPFPMQGAPSNPPMYNIVPNARSTNNGDAQPETRAAVARERGGGRVPTNPRQARIRVTLFVYHPIDITRDQAEAVLRALTREGAAVSYVQIETFDMSKYQKEYSKVTFSMIGGGDVFQVTKDIKAANRSWVGGVKLGGLVIHYSEWFCLNPLCQDRGISKVYNRYQGYQTNTQHREGLGKCRQSQYGCKGYQCETIEDYENQWQNFGGIEG